MDRIESIINRAKQRADDWFEVFSWSYHRDVVFVKDGVFHWLRIDLNNHTHEWLEPTKEDIETFKDNDENFKEWIKQYI